MQIALHRLASEIGVVSSTGVNRCDAALLAIDRVVVQKGLHTRIVFRRDLEHEALAGFEDDACRPDLNLDRHDRAGFQLLELIVSVVGAVGPR